MASIPTVRALPWKVSLATICMVSASMLPAQTCQIAAEVDPARLDKIHAAAQRYADLAQQGDLSALQAASTPGAAGEFSPVTKETFSRLPGGGKSAMLAAFLLDASASDAPLPHAEFLCGSFSRNGQTANSAIFTLTNLHPAEYAVIEFGIDPTKPADQPVNLSLVLQNLALTTNGAEKTPPTDDWKLAAAYVNPSRMAGHDSDWFAASAKQFEEKKQLHNAWLYLQTARALASPLPFMSNARTDALYDEGHKIQPSDFPVDGKPVDFQAGTASQTLIGIGVQDTGGDLTLVVRYRAASVADTVHTRAQSMDLIRALLHKLPELRSAFGAVVARAVTPAGADFGTRVEMESILPI